MTKLKEIGEAFEKLAPMRAMPRQAILPQAGASELPDLLEPAANLSSGLSVADNRWLIAARTPSDEGQACVGDLMTVALVGNLAIERRRYEDLCRAYQRLELQAMAMCRYSFNGDKEAGAKLYRQVVKDPAHPLAVWLMPYFEAMKPLETAKAAQAKSLAKLARQLPVWPWAEGVGGLSDRFLGMIVGECGAPVGEFKSVSAVWKRMGLAVIDGGRQRRVLGDAAIEHGYVARRRSLMWNIGESLIKAQVRKDPEDAEKRIGIGPYGTVYLERKVYELTKTDRPIIAHSRAKRYMEKRLLRELWKAWRAA